MLLDTFKVKLNPTKKAIQKYLKHLKEIKKIPKLTHCDIQNLY